MKKNNIISDWLDKYGDPKIDKYIEIQLNQNKMEKEFVPYKLAVKLKVLGFDEPCFGSWWFNPSIHKLNEEELQIIKSYYFGLPEYCILAPTFSQSFRWFREKYNINGYQFIYQTMAWGYALSSMEEHDQVNGYFETYEEAELACLKELIEIAETRTK